MGFVDDAINASLSKRLNSTSFKIKGMSRDMSVSAHSSDYAFENMNIRITARDNNTALSISNERGNKEIDYIAGSDTQATYEVNREIKGKFLGSCILNNYLVLFTKDDDIDYIYRIQYNGTSFFKIVLFSGNLGFNLNNPIETLGLYEDEKIQKVYWVDGLNSPRVINIVNENLMHAASNNETIDPDIFNFSREVKFPKINVTKNMAASGIFSSGVIQYAFSYLNKYGQESNIVYTTPLYYISYEDRGAGPDEKVGNSFNITATNLDARFDYLRVYSIHRSSLDTTPEVKLVANVGIPSTAKNDASVEISYTDSGTTGSVVTPTTLLYTGCEDFTAGTLAQKDNTLFFGNLTLKRNLIPANVISFFKDSASSKLKFQSSSISTDDSSLEPSKHIYIGAKNSLYPYKNQLAYNSSQITTFKYKDWYRFGVQFQYKNGKWSEPIFVKDLQNNVKIKESLDNDTVDLTYARLKLDSSANAYIQSLLDIGYRRIRPVVVFPNAQDRNCICQGIVNPTMFSVGDRASNTPYAQASWFFRPTALNVASDDSGAFNTNGNKVFYHNYIGYKIADDSTVNHNTPLPSNYNRNAEIQNTYYTESNQFAGTTDITPSLLTTKDVNEFIQKNKYIYFIDQSIFTLNSPDVEFNSSFKTIDPSSFKFRVVGYIPFTSSLGDIYINTSVGQNTFNNDQTISTPGFYHRKFENVGLTPNGSRGLLSGLFWSDEVSGRIEGQNVTSLLASYMVYPWQRVGSISNSSKPTAFETKNGRLQTAILSKKVVFNLKCSYNTMYLDNIWEAESDAKHPGITGASLFDSNEITMVKIPAQHSSLNDIVYYGNMDKLSVNVNQITLSNTGTKKFQGTPIVSGIIYHDNSDGSDSPYADMEKVFSSDLGPLSVKIHTSVNVDGSLAGFGENIYKDVSRNLATADPSNIRFKSTPHIISALKYATVDSNLKQICLPKISPTVKDADNVEVIPSTHMFWEKDSSNYLKGSLTDYIYDNENVAFDYLLMGEFYHDDNQIKNRFGGNTEESFENNIWLPCGEPVDLALVTDDTKPIIIDYTEGDTFYQRYDCMKTYSFTTDDVNSIIDIASFMCETRYNIDGRYDRNRGAVNNFALTPAIYNKLNTVYSQKNNFFNYNGLNHNKIQIDYFPNQITFSTTKVLGELVDSWTNINLISTVDMDGDKGQINSLQVFNNEIYSFQDKGLSRILFNDKVVINAANGVPFQIANSEKVNGKIYLSNSVGANNKWSILNSPNGIYWIDNLSNSLYVFNTDNGLQCLSDVKGFRQWVSENNTLDLWNSVTFKNFRTYYDKSNNDVYFVNGSYCLCYSEYLREFVSFMSYESVPLMCNFGDRFVSFKNNELWLQNEGEYNQYYGIYHPYYMTFRVNPEFQYDKIFNNIEFRSDTWNGEKLTNKTFDTLTVWDEYQWGQSLLNNMNSRPSSLKQKFRIWRAFIPRDKHNNIDRMRNPWIYLKLGFNANNTYRTEFHDLTVYYYDCHNKN